MHTIRFFDSLVHHSGKTQVTPFDEWRDALTRVADRMRRTVLVWQERSMYRRELSELDGHMLDDIGISRANAMREINKPFWRA